jgi:hypothetical protein
MGLLDRGQPAIDLGEMRVALCLGEGAVERGAVDLAPEIGPVAAGGFALAHDDVFLSLARVGAGS